MKKLIPILGALTAFLLSGCSTLFTPASEAQFKQTVTDPNNIAKGLQITVAGISTGVLANNPTYVSVFQGAGDAFSVLATSNLQTLTAQDIQAALAKTNLSAKAQADIAAAATTALGDFNTSFGSLPTLKPNYAIFLQAIANGLNLATGRAAVTLPVIPWPPASSTTTSTSSAVVAPAPDATTATAPSGT